MISRVKLKLYNHGKKYFYMKTKLLYLQEKNQAHCFIIVITILYFLSNIPILKCHVLLSFFLRGGGWFVTSHFNIFNKHIMLLRTFWKYC